MNKSLYILSVILMILLAILVKQQANLAQKNPIRQEPKEYMLNLNLYNYDEAGKLKDYITGNSWEFIPQQKCSIIQQPRVNIYKKPKYSYKVSAASGKILQQTLNGKIELIKLISQVAIKQNNEQDSTEFNLDTSYLEFNPNTNIANTEQSVKIYKPGLVTTSDGMRANLNTHQLELKKNVVTTYQN